MSTCSTIAVQFPNGTILQSNCHHDGYLEGVGRHLVNCYNTESRAENLIALGDISSLHEHLAPVGPHSFEAPEQGVTVFYGRDHGEIDIDPIAFRDLKDYDENLNAAEYNYIFADDTWSCHTSDRYIPDVARALYDNHTTKEQQQ